MTIGIYTTMPLTTEYVGVHGITFLFFPLIKRWKALGHRVIFFGKVVSNNQKSIFCDILKLKPYIIDVSNDIEVYEDKFDLLAQCDVLYVYNRPGHIPEVFDEYLNQNRCMQAAVSLKIPVLFLLGSLWLPPVELSSKIALLRPFRSVEYDRLFRSAYYWDYYIHDLIDYEFEVRERVIDYVYIGNFYNRFDDFKLKFKDLKGKIVVGGSWIRDPERWSQSLQLQNVLFIGQVPFSMCLPLLAISKRTVDLLPVKYKELGMQTSRVFEAKMAGCEIDVVKSEYKTLDAANDLFWHIVCLEREKT